VIDASCDGELDGGIGFLLLNPSHCKRSKSYDAGHMSGLAQSSCEHFPPPVTFPALFPIISHTPFEKHGLVFR
jgi:hypothetical protein